MNPRRRRRPRWAAAIGALTVIAACGADAPGSEGAGDTQPVPATAESSTTAAATTTPAAPVTTTPEATSATTTTATTTTAAPASTSTTGPPPSNDGSTATTAPGAPTTTGDDAEGPVAAIDFGTDDPRNSSPGVFGFEFGRSVDVESVRSTIDPVLGDPDADTGWQPMPERLECSGAPEYRSILWDDLRFVFAGGDRDGDGEPEPDHVTLWGWSLGDTELFFSPPLETSIDGASGLTSASGLGIGSPADAIGEEGFDSVFDDEDGSRLGLVGGSAAVFDIADGRVQSITVEPLDCFTEEEL